MDSNLQNTPKKSPGIYKIVRYPDPILKQVSQPVAEVNDQIRELMDGMLMTLRFCKGLGISAVQVGELLRIFVIDDEEKGPLYFVNPKLYDISEETVRAKEGCLSVVYMEEGRGISVPFKPVTRPKECMVDYLDYNGNSQTMRCTGLLAQCVQHEFDHLNGTVFLDHLSRINRESILKKLNKNG